MISYIDNPNNVSSADIVVGIPSLNEAETIAIPTEQASIELMQYFSDYTSVIINVDNNSKDGTKEAEAIEERLNRNFQSGKDYLIKHWDARSKNSEISKQLSKLDVSEKKRRSKKCKSKN